MKNTSRNRVKTLKVEATIEGKARLQESSEQRARKHDTAIVKRTTGIIALRTVPVCIKVVFKNCKLIPFWMM